MKNENLNNVHGCHGKKNNYCYHGNRIASFRIFQKKKRKQIGFSLSIISCEQGAM